MKVSHLVYRDPNTFLGGYNLENIKIYPIKYGQQEFQELMLKKD